MSVMRRHSGLEKAVICLAHWFRISGGIAHRKLYHQSSLTTGTGRSDLRVIEDNIVFVVWGICEEVCADDIVRVGGSRGLLIEPSTPVSSFSR